MATTSSAMLLEDALVLAAEIRGPAARRPCAAPKALLNRLASTGAAEQFAEERL